MVNTQLKGFLFGAILFLIGVIVLVVGAQVVGVVKDTATRDTLSIGNESATTTIGTPVTLTNAWISSVTGVYNTTRNLASTEFSLISGSTAISQVNITNTSLGNGSYFYNYTYLTDTAAFNTSEKGEAGVIVFGDFLPVIAIIIVLVVIVGLLIGTLVLFGQKP